MPLIAPRLVVTLLAALAAQPLFADTVNWTGTTSGNWSNGANWSTNPSAPAASGDDIVFSLGDSITSSVDSTWSINSLTFQSTAGNYTLSGGPLTIGAGGITNNKTTGTITLGANLVLSANQTWALNGSGGNGRIIASGNWSGSGNITKSGGADLILGLGSVDTWTGSFTLDRGTVTFNTGTPITRLGSQTIFVNNNGGGSTFNINIGGTANRVWANNITFTDLSGPGNNNLIYSFTANSGTNGTINLTGNLSSTNSLTESIRFYNLASDSTGSLLRFRLGGDNSGLTSSIVPVPAAGSLDGAVVVRGAFVSLDSANALGLNNGLHVSIGENNSATADRSSGLSTTGGNNVSAAIRIRRNDNTTTPTTQHVYLGIEGAGSAAYSGGIMLESSANTSHRGAHLHLKTDTAGSSVTFSGPITNFSNTDAVRTNDVWVEGPGTVILSGANTYTAKTTVKSGATLLVNNTSGSGTGSGAVEVESGAFLGGTGTISGAVTLLAGGTLSPGNGGAGLLSGGSSFLWNSNNTSGGLLFNLGATPELSDSLSLGGAFTKGTGTSFLFEFSGVAAPSLTYTLVSFGSNSGFSVGDFSANIEGTFGLTANALTFTAAAVPEPSSFGLFAGLAAIGCAVSRARRRRS